MVLSAWICCPCPSVPPHDYFTKSFWQGEEASYNMVLQWRIQETSQGSAKVIASEASEKKVLLCPAHFLLREHLAVINYSCSKAGLSDGKKNKLVRNLIFHCWLGSAGFFRRLTYAGKNVREPFTASLRGMKFIMT